MARGGTIADIERVIGVPEVFEHRPGSNGAPAARVDDEMEEALRLRRRYEGIGMISSVRKQAETESEAMAAEAGVRLEEAKLRQRKLELEAEELELRINEMRRERGAPDATVQILIQTLQTLREDKQSVSEQLAAYQVKMMEQMGQQLDSLRSQLADRAANGATDAPSRRSIAEEIADVKAVYETIFPPAASAPVASLATSLDDVIKLHGIQEAHEIRMADIRRQDRIYDRQVEKEDARSAEDTRRGTALTDTLKGLTPTLENVLGKVGERFAGGGGGVAPAAAPATADLMPPGTKLTTCPQCQQIVGFAPGYELGVCPNCQAKLQYQDNTALPFEPAATAEPPE